MTQPQFDTFDDVLEHYGVKGMKWGIRRGDSTASSRAADIAARAKSAATSPQGKQVLKIGARVGLVSLLTAVGVPAVVSSGLVSVSSTVGSTALAKTGKEMMDQPPLAGLRAEGTTQLPGRFINAEGTAPRLGPGGLLREKMYPGSGDSEYVPFPNAPFGR